MPRVILRRAVLEDADTLIRANRESRAHHHPWVVPFTDQAGFDAWFERLETGTKVALVAREAATDSLVGVVSLSEIVMTPSFQSAYLGYWGLAATAGRGLMTEAVGLAVRHAFDVVGLHRVEANIQPGNARSIALIKRLGFRLEGYSPRYLKVDGDWRDHERWALLADEVA